ncbi:unnamed protein product [Ectocarpus fasciculatus]
MARQAVVATLASVLTALCCSQAFAFVGTGINLNLHSTRWNSCGTRGMRMEVEELEQLNPAIKGKKLEIVDEAEGVWKYEFDIEAPGPRTQSLNHRILREIKNKSDFPGYRKGEIPPRLMPEATKYVIEEVMNEGLQTALATYNLVGAKGDGSEADIKNDIEDMLKVFKPGKPLSFSCTFDAKPKPEDENDGPDGDAAAVDAA